MKARFPDVVEKGRMRRPGRETAHGDTYGDFVMKGPRGVYLMIVAIDGAETGFDHVSVSVRVDGRPPERCPTWEEMCFVKDLFWDADELVIQYHPPKSEYVNHHPFVLHLWKPLAVSIPLPPKVCV